MQHSPIKKSAIYSAEFLENLVKTSADVSETINKISKDGYTPLTAAASLDVPDAMDLIPKLVAKGAVINMEDGNKNTALKIAIESQRNQLLTETILASGAFPTLANVSAAEALNFHATRKQLTESRERIQNSQSSISRDNSTETFSAAGSSENVSLNYDSETKNKRIKTEDNNSHPNKLFQPRGQPETDKIKDHPDPSGSSKKRGS